MKYFVELTRSQHMALIDLIAHSLQCRCDQRVEEFIDDTVSPAVRTSPGELLRAVSDAPLWADGGVIPTTDRGPLVGEEIPPPPPAGERPGQPFGGFFFGKRKARKE